MFTGVGYFGLVIGIIYCVLWYRESSPVERTRKLQVAVWSGVIGSTSFILLDILKG